MSDFYVHPAIRSPFVAGVIFAGLGMAFVDAGVTDMLLAAGESSITAESWADLTAGRWSAGGISGMVGAFGWFLLFRTGSMDMKVPAAGILAAIIGPAAGGWLIWNMYQSLQMPEFAVGAPAIWRLAFLWSFLVVLVSLGCLRLGFRAFRVMRGGA